MTSDEWESTSRRDIKTIGCKEDIVANKHVLDYLILKNV